ncbi:MAG: peptide deformylase [Thermoanaerobaculia bacterium]|nr:peptide deformylase [Thermoanaerobaculia bacterium]
MRTSRSRGRRVEGTPISGPESGAERPILLLGDPRLRIRSEEVVDFEQPEFRGACAGLAATLASFRARHGFGRAISAPQIGVALRLIAVNLGDGPRFVVNPRVTARSAESFTMWDDCMSFPGLLVRLRRDRSVTLRYHDETGIECEWPRMELAASELLQHEIDHLDGVLAIDRAIDRDAIVLREVFERRKAELSKQVDYMIGDPTKS